MNVYKADTANLAKNKKTIDTFAAAIRSYESAIKAYETIPRAIARTESAKVQAAAQYMNATTDVAGGLEMSKLICTKGY